MSTYTISQRLTWEMMGLKRQDHGKTSCVLWLITPVAKDHHCASCDALIPRRSVAFRPFANVSYRGERLCVLCVRRLEDEDNGQHHSGQSG